MKKTLFIAAALILGGIVWSVLDSVHPFGEPMKTPVDDYYIAHALKDRSSENIVTSLVFDYRGFDTIGEGAVLFTALCSVTALFRQGGKRD